MAKRDSEVELRLTADNQISPSVKDATQDIKKFREEIRDLGKEKSAATGLARTREQARQLGAELIRLMTEQEQLQNQMNSFSGDANEQRLLERDLNRLNKVIDTQSELLRETTKEADRYQRSAQRLGVDVGNLAREQARLSTSLSRAKGQLENAEQQRAQSLAMAAHRKELSLLARQYRSAGGNLSGWREQLRLANSDVNRLGLAVIQFRREQEVANTTTRNAPTLYHRLRAEVLGLTAAYIGLHNAGRAVTSTFDTQTQLLAARNRFSVGLGNDQAAGDELDFARESAKALGLQLEAVLEDYSKFVAASRGLGFSQEELRHIFTGTAKAITVNKLSVADARGVYTALTQIMSKNQVMAEELRQQLGDRLPGAVNLMASAVGVTTAELSEMLENGELGADVLIQFADELNRAFGPKLAQSLESPQAKLNAFQNTLFDLREELAESGFIDELTDQLQAFGEELQKPSTRAGLKDLAALAGDVAKGALILAQNLDLLAGVLAGLVSYRLVQGLVSLAGALRLALASGAGLAALSGPIGATLAVLAAIGTYLYANREATGAAAVGSKEYESHLASLRRELNQTKESLVGVNTALRDNQLSKLGEDLALSEARIESAREALEKLEKAGRQRFRGDTTGARQRQNNQRLDPQKEKLKQDIALLEQEAAAIKARREALLGDADTELPGRTRVDSLTKEQIKQFEALERHHQNALKRITEAETRSLNERLSLARAAEEQRTQLIASQEGKRQAIIGQLNRQYAETLQRQTDSGQDLSSQLSETTEAVQAQKQALDQLSRIRVSSEKVFDYDNAVIVTEYTQQAIADIRQEFETLSSLGDTINFDVFRARFEQLRQELMSSQTGSMGPMADALQRALDEQTIAYREFFDQVIRRGISDVQGSIRAGVDRDIELLLADVRQQIARLKEDGQGASAPSQELLNRFASLAERNVIEERFNQILGDRRELLDILQQADQNRAAIDEESRANIESQLSANERLLDQLARIAESNGFDILAQRIRQAATASKALATDAEKAQARLDGIVAGGLSNAVASFVTGTQSAREAMRSFSQSVLAELTRMIAKWAILNAMAGGNGPSLTSVAAGQYHSGGRVTTESARRMPSWVFNTAPRYHTGGVAGLKPNEVPAVLEKGEEVLTKNDPRHRFNGGLTAQPPTTTVNMKAVNVFETRGLAQELLNTPENEKVFINFIRRYRHLL